MPILFYHRVSDDGDPLAVPPRRFRAQVEVLADEGYTVVGAPEAARRALEAGATDRLVGLSFDDGYLDVAQEAAPLLARHGFSATVFVVTGVLDGVAALSWYQRPPPMMTWNDVLALDREATLGFEPHTVMHPDLRSLDASAARAEIVGSKDRLEERLDRAVTTFCYPAGLFGARDRRLVGEAGFAYAVTCEPGAATPAADPLALPRILIEGADSLLDFRAKLAGAHDRPLPLRAAYRRRRLRSG